MKNVPIIFLLTAGLLVTACGKDDAGQSSKAAAPAPAASAPSKAAPAATTPATEPVAAAMPSGDGATQYIDHAKDEIEFELKKSLAGLESLLEDVSDSEQVAAIKKDIAALESKLAEL